jgi:hypothetical protein
VSAFPPALHRDRHGAFIDIVAVDEGSGHTTTTKTPSAPADPAQVYCPDRLVHCRAERLILM